MASGGRKSQTSLWVWLPGRSTLLPWIGHTYTGTCGQNTLGELKKKKGHKLCLGRIKERSGEQMLSKYIICMYEMLKNKNITLILKTHKAWVWSGWNGECLPTSCCDSHSTKLRRQGRPEHWNNECTIFLLRLSALLPHRSFSAGYRALGGSPCFPVSRDYNARTLASRQQLFFCLCCCSWRLLTASADLCVLWNAELGCLLCEATLGCALCLFLTICLWRWLLDFSSPLWYWESNPQPHAHEISSLPQDSL